MKKRLALILFLLVGSVASWAQETRGVFVVSFKDGTSLEYALADNPSVHFTNETLSVSYPGDEVVLRCNNEDVLKFFFKDGVPNGISDLEAQPDKDVVVEYIDGEYVRMKGLDHIGKVRVYTLDGREVRADVSCDAHEVSVRLSSLDKGVYVISVNGRQSIKIMRR